MKVLLINGSPHANGSTYTALKEVADTLNIEGIETEIVQVGHLDIRGCIGCGTCFKTKQCVFNDIVEEMKVKFEECYFKHILKRRDKACTFKCCERINTDDCFTCKEYN